VVRRADSGRRRTLSPFSPSVFGLPRSIQRLKGEYWRVLAQFVMFFGAPFQINGSIVKYFTMCQLLEAFITFFGGFPRQSHPSWFAGSGGAP